jgi:hypothetical protein
MFFRNGGYNQPPIDILLYYFNQQKSDKIIHQKPEAITQHWSTHPIMSENYANRALCPKNTKTPRQLGTGNIAYPETPSK